MLLAIDIGNSSVKMGVHNGVAWVWTDQTTAQFESLRAKLSPLLDQFAIGQIGVSSVAPETGNKVVESLERIFPIHPVVISHTMRLPFSMGYATPETLGTDRIAAVAGALSLRKRGDAPKALVVLDAGTAVTIDAVSAQNDYLGGSILPGPDLLRAALAGGTEQLPLIEWTEPESPIGSSTTEAIRAGLVIPFLAGIRFLLLETVDQLSGTPEIIGTGGWSAWLADRIPDIGRVEPHLVLDGIRALVQGQSL